MPAELVANLTTSGAPLSPTIADAVKAEEWHGYVYVAAILVATVLGSFCNYHAQLLSYSLGIRIRSAFTLLIYKKALHIRPNKAVTIGLITFVKCTAFLVGYLLLKKAHPTLTTTGT